MLRRFRGSSPLIYLTILVATSLHLSGCVGVTPLTPFSVVVTVTPTHSPTPRPTNTPRPSPTPSPSNTPTPTQTLAPTPTRDPSLPRFPTPELGEIEQVEEGGFAFRTLSGYEVRLQENQVTLFNEQTGIAVSLYGFSTRNYGSVERVINGLLNNMAKSFTTFSSEPIFPNPVDGHEGLAAIIHGELEDENISGLVVVLAPSDTQLFYSIAIIPDSPEGSVWQSDGWPVMDAVLSSLEFFPPTGD